MPAAVLVGADQPAVELRKLANFEPDGVLPSVFDAERRKPSRQACY